MAIGSAGADLLFEKRGGTVDCQALRRKAEALRRDVGALDTVKYAAVELCNDVFRGLDQLPEIIEEVQALERKRDKLRREVANLEGTLRVHLAEVADVLLMLRERTVDVAMRRHLRDCADALARSNGSSTLARLRAQVLL